MTSNTIIPVILCGGSGTRLWPLSRKSFPKQFLSLSSNSNKSLLQLTQERINNSNIAKEPIVICNEEHRFLVAEQMREINIKPRAIILEPFGRNTAPAITLAAIKSLELEENPILLILSSDHMIEDTKEFLKVIEAGLDYVNQRRLVAFGIVPKSPETGYGYIKSENPINNTLNLGSKIDCFVEKPDFKKAKQFITDKRYTWNSGMFLFHAKTILDEIKLYSPEIIEHCGNALKDNLFDLDFQ